MIRITFLGTSAARPTVRRNVSAIAVQREGNLVLFDCGEGTQRQMMRFGTGFAVEEIFFSHMHADHFLGVTGLVRTLGLQGRTEALRLYGPRGSRSVLRAAVRLGVDRTPFEIEIEEVEPGFVVQKGDYRIEAISVRHGASAVGWSLIEDPRLGRFDVDLARELGVPDGPLFGRLHRGETIEVAGKTIAPEQVVGVPRPGRKVVYTGDTCPSRKTGVAAEGADLLIHDATFGAEEAQRAKDTLHSTARGAAKVARDANVKRLVLTHISARYDDDPGALEREARAVFPATIVAKDGMVIEVPYRDEVAEPGTGG